MTKKETLAAQKKFKHQCDFCDRRFKTQTVMYIHRANCPYNYATIEEVFEVQEQILDVFDRIGARWFLIKYVGYEDPEWNREHLLL